MKKQFLILALLLLSFCGYSQNFQYIPVNQTKGEFPGGWDVVSGLAIVDEIDGKPVINIQHGGIIKPIVEGKDDRYLRGDFTLEFDAYFDQASNMTGQRYEIRLWQGRSGYNQNNLQYAPFTIARNGLKTTWSTPEYGSASNYFQDLETLSPVWRHIKVEYANGGLKIFMDDRLLLQFPRFKIQPSMLSIGGGINESIVKGVKLGITNVSIQGVAKETFVVMFVDRQTNLVQDITLFENIEEAKPLFPNTRAYFGTIVGDYAVRAYVHSDLPKPDISSAGNTGTKTVRAYERSDIPKLNFSTSPTMTSYSLIPAKEAQLQFDLDQGVNTESLTSSYQPTISKGIEPIYGDHFDQNQVYIAPTATLTLKNSQLVLEVKNTTTPNYAPISAPEGQLIAGQMEKPLKLKVTLTDLLCIKTSGDEATYLFGQSIEYKAINSKKLAVNKESGDKAVGNSCTHSNENCALSKYSFFENTLAHKVTESRLSSGITLSQTGKKESNVMNSLVFEISAEELNDPDASFRVQSYLFDNSSDGLFSSRKVLYDSYLDVAIFDLLQDLIKADRGETLSGFTEPFHDPEIMKAQYGLFKTYDSGPNAGLWVRQVGKTLEGPISLGTTTANDGQRGAAWIKFEIVK